MTTIGFVFTVILVCAVALLIYLFVSNRKGNVKEEKHVHITHVDSAPGDEHIEE